MTEAGERWETVRIVNDVERLTSVMAGAGVTPTHQVAAARKQIGYVYYALRDHQVRALDRNPRTVRHEPHR
jgi:hypothetical protein